MSQVSTQAPQRPKPTPRPFPAIGKLDEWGNIILSSRGWEGQYRIKRWADGQEAFVCGQWLTMEHLPWWKFDPHQGFICRKCWPREGKKR